MAGSAAFNTAREEARRVAHQQHLAVEWCDDGAHASAGPASRQSVHQPGTGSVDRRTASHCHLPLQRARSWQEVRDTPGALVILQPRLPGDVLLELPAWEAAWLEPASHDLASRRMTGLQLQIGSSAWHLPAPRMARWFRQRATLVADGVGVMVRKVRTRAAAAAVQLPEDLSPLLRRIYAARNVHSGDELATGLEALLPVGSLEGVHDAAALLQQHMAGRVLIVGDFDADGATSTALMMHALTEWGFGQWISWCRTVSGLVMD